MTLSDRRLLIELSAVLVIKLAIIFLLKVHFFGPAPVDHPFPSVLARPQRRRRSPKAPTRIELDGMLRPSYHGSFWGLLTPFALISGLLSIAMLAMHGGAWLQLKTQGLLLARARCYGDRRRGGDRVVYSRRHMAATGHRRPAD